MPLHLKIILLFVGKILYLCFHKNKTLTAMKRKDLLFYILLLQRMSASKRGILPDSPFYIYSCKCRVATSGDKLYPAYI